LRALFSATQVERLISEKMERADEKSLKVLQYIGEEFVNNARTSGNYQDHTGNLRSSIGYIILKDGALVTENFAVAGRGTDRRSGVKRAKIFADEIAARYTTGWVLIGVAGMEYAAYVEAKRGYDVIEGSAPTTDTFKQIFSAIEL